MPEMPRTSVWHLPIPDHETYAYWEATAHGKLLIRYCRSCRRAYFYPRDHCPRCWGTDTEWMESSGRGRIYTFTVIHQNDLPPFRDRVPYVVAVVELEEGVRLTTNIEGCQPEEVRCEMPVRVDFRTELRAEGEPISLPVFRPA